MGQGDGVQMYGVVIEDVGGGCGSVLSEMCRQLCSEGERNVTLDGVEGVADDWHNAAELRLELARGVGR